MAVQRVNLTDDDLWRAVAENTYAISALHQRQVELVAAIANDPVSRPELMRPYLDTFNTLEREYRIYTAELRRRYPA